MRYKIFLIGFFICTLFVQSSFGQSERYSKRQKKTFLEADSYFDYGDYLTAKKLFLSIYEADSLEPEVNYKVGYSLYQLKERDSALTFLIRGVDYNLDANYLIAEIYLYLGKLDQSKKSA